LKKVREDIGLTNVEIMVPLVRTLGEAKTVIELLADVFLEHFDGFSIGSNDMTQMTLALDRDSAIIAEGFDERDPAVKHMLHLAIQACRKAGKYVGTCGQGPSDHPDLAKWLMEEGIESLSLNPDTVVETWLYRAREVANAAAAR
jgi:pyruvate,water dikinase